MLIQISNRHPVPHDSRGLKHPQIHLLPPSTLRNLRGLCNRDNRLPSPLSLCKQMSVITQTALFAAMTNLDFAHWLQNLKLDWKPPFWVGAHRVLNCLSHSPSMCSCVLQITEPGRPTYSRYTVQIYWLNCTAATTSSLAITISERSLIAIDKCHGRYCINFFLCLQEQK